MENVNVAEFGSTEKTTENYSYKLSSPMPFLWTMVLFLVIVGFIAAILFRQAQTAFMHNPGLNGLILGVLGIGIILIREAGGYVSDWDGGTSMLETGGVVAGNEHIQKALLEVAKRPVPSR